jgi:hypothetical protein
MAEIVNLRRARKRRARTEQAVAADAHRAAHGQTKAERTLTKARRAADAVKLEGHLLDRDGEPS